MQETSQDQQRLPHPLEPLTEEEVRRTAAIVRAHPGFADGSTFVSTALREPGRAEMADYELAGRPPARGGSGMTSRSSTARTVEVSRSTVTTRFSAGRANVLSVGEDPTQVRALATRAPKPASRSSVKPGGHG